MVLAEPEIALGDCRIEWADGGVTRDSATTEAAIADMVRRYVIARAPCRSDARPDPARAWGDPA